MFIQSNLGDVLYLNHITMESVNCNLLNPRKSGKDTKYLKILGGLSINSMSHKEIVDEFCEGDLIYEGKWVKNHNMVSMTLSSLIYYGLTESKNHRHSLTEKGVRYLELVNKPGFKRFEVLEELNYYNIKIKYPSKSRNLRAKYSDIEISKMDINDYNSDKLPKFIDHGLFNEFVSDIDTHWRFYVDIDEGKLILIGRGMFIKRGVEHLNGGIKEYIHKLIE